MSNTFSVVRAVLGVAVAAFVIWLIVRLVNERKKHGRKLWAFLAMLYVVSIGPAGRIANDADAQWIMYPYLPILLLAKAFRPLAELLFLYWGLCGVRIS